MQASVTFAGRGFKARYMSKEIRVETPESKEQEIQQKLILYQLLRGHAEELRQNAVLLERMFIETEASQQAINDIKKANENSDILISLGSGIFTQGKSYNKKNMLADIGAGFLAEKDIDSVNGILDMKRKEIEKASAELNNEIISVFEKMQRLEGELERMTRKKQ